MSISVIIPTYNRGPAVQKTLDSILAQTLAPLEIIVVDDGSTDETPAWIEAHYGEAVRVIRQPNGGVARARNRGLELARGQYIAFCDHDDLWAPRKLELQAELLQRRPKVGVAYCLWRDVDEDSRELEADDWRRIKPKYGFPDGEVFDVLVRANFIVSMSVPLVRTALLREIGGFDARTAPVDDWDLWLRLARKCEFAPVKTALVDYVHHPLQQSGDEEKMWRAANIVLSKHRRAVLKQPRTLWIVLSYGYFLRTLHPFYHRARAAVGRGDWPEVRRQIARCCWRYPLCLLVPQWLYILKRLVRRDSTPF